MDNKYGHTGKTLCKSETGFEVGIATYYNKLFKESKEHKDEEIIYVLQGQGVVRIGEEYVEIEKGSTIYIPPNTDHCIRITSPKPMKALYCHSGTKNG